MKSNIRRRLEKAAADLELYFLQSRLRHRQKRTYPNNLNAQHDLWPHCLTIILRRSVIEIIDRYNGFFIELQDITKSYWNSCKLYSAKFGTIPLSYLWSTHEVHMYLSRFYHPTKVTMTIKGIRSHDNGFISVSIAHVSNVYHSMT